MWTDGSAWRRSLDGDLTAGASTVALPAPAPTGDTRRAAPPQGAALPLVPLEGAAYYTALDALAEQLRGPTEELLNRPGGQSAAERDEEIRSVLIRGAVDAYNRRADELGERLLSPTAARDLFAHLRSTHGALSPLFADPAITDIHINGPAARVWVMRDGRHAPTEIRLTAAQIESYLEVWAAGRHTLTPINWGLDVMYEETRVSAIHPQIAPGGPIVSLRRHRAAPLAAADLVALGLLPEPVMAWLLAVYKGRANIAVGGGMGSGKTTLLQVCLDALGADERFVVIEDTRELRLGHENYIHLLTHPPVPGDPERRGEVTQRDLVVKSLRHGAGRIIIGECRGAEALDMLRAMTTGHDGSITTVHARSTRGIPEMLETLCAQAGEHLPLASLRHLIAHSIDLLLVVRQLPEGRRLTEVAELVGVTEAGTYSFADLLVYEDGRLCATGYELSPPLQRRLADAGADLAALHSLLAAVPAARTQGTGRYAEP